jgi:hypothetical protein
MAETKQISATIKSEIATGIFELAQKENHSFSRMVEILLKKGLLAKGYIVDTIPRGSTKNSKK